MGTNYYHVAQQPCEKCNRPYPSRHIGKSSGGWTFALHVYPDDGIRTLEDWKRLFQQGHIEDEYGERVPRKLMLSIITEREHRMLEKVSPEERSKFLLANYAVDGPNNLLRCAIEDRTNCIGHGEGTWDYLVGEFS